jgi:hypothetical protein
MQAAADQLDANFRLMSPQNRKVCLKNRLHSPPGREWQPLLAASVSKKLNIPSGGCAYDKQAWYRDTGKSSVGGYELSAPFMEAAAGCCSACASNVACTHFSVAWGKCLLYKDIPVSTGLGVSGEWRLGQQMLERTPLVGATSGRVIERTGGGTPSPYFEDVE